MGELRHMSASVRFSINIRDIGGRARRMPQSLSDVGYIGMERREVGTILVEDCVWGGEHTLEQQRLAVAAREDIGELLRGGEAAGTLRPEGVLHGIARREMRDGEMEILDGFLGSRVGLEKRGQHAFQRLRQGTATGEGLGESACDRGDELGVAFRVALGIGRWPTLPAQSELQRGSLQATPRELGSNFAGEGR